MTILAVYYTFADLVLLAQCLWYRGLLGGKGRKMNGGEGVGDGDRAAEGERDERAEEEPLLARTDEEDARRGSAHGVDGTHLSPATPLLSSSAAEVEAPATARLNPTSTLQSVLFNLTALLVVCAAGVFGWWLSTRSQHPSLRHEHQHHHNQHHNHNHDDSNDHATGQPPPTPLHLDLWGQIFGYLCAALYLGSRIPQLLLNYRRQSTEGVSMLFFLFACVGNLTYVLSIMAYEPDCAREAAVDAVVGALLVGRRGTRGRKGGGGGGMAGACGDGERGRQYARYLLVNASWLVGSAGTLGLDAGVFVQFWWYRGRSAGRVIGG